MTRTTEKACDPLSQQIAKLEQEKAVLTDQVANLTAQVAEGNRKNNHLSDELNQEKNTPIERKHLSLLRAIQYLLGFQKGNFSYKDDTEELSDIKEGLGRLEQELMNEGLSVVFDYSIYPEGFLFEKVTKDLPKPVVTLPLFMRNGEPILAGLRFESTSLQKSDIVSSDNNQGITAVDNRNFDIAAN